MHLTCDEFPSGGLARAEALVGANHVLAVAVVLTDGGVVLALVDVQLTVDTCKHPVSVR